MISPTVLPSTEPQAVGLSAERLGHLGDVLSREAAGGRLPGAVALVARRGKLAYITSVGRRDPAGEAAMSVDSIFRVYSMTKPVVSVAAMMLVEQGRALLADPLAKYLPAFAGTKVAVERPEPGGARPRFELVPAERPVTLQDLLRQTSGYTYEHTATEALKPLYREAGTARRDQKSRRSCRKARDPAADLPAGIALALRSFHRSSGACHREHHWTAPWRGAERDDPAAARDER